MDDFAGITRQFHLEGRANTGFALIWPRFRNKILGPLVHRHLDRALLRMLRNPLALHWTLLPSCVMEHMLRITHVVHDGRVILRKPLKITVVLH